MLETFLVAALVDLFGFFTGVFAWWLLADVPGLSTAFFFWLSLALGVIGFLFGLWRPEGATDALGTIGEKLLSFANEVWSWFRFFR